MQAPELSIIIPTLNEAAALPLLLEDLAGQQAVKFEVIVADGGSVDDTRKEASKFFGQGKLHGELLACSTGRGRQLNAGARAACARWLLFLHADSRIAETDQLRKSLDFIAEANCAQATDTIAGHFALKFDLPDAKAPFGFYYYEAKASLGRLGCIHGDQGMLVASSLFERLGPFREDLPVMEDTSFAEVVRTHGQWRLLPGTLRTSARRFLEEGLRERQTLNALMMNFLAIGWFDFFAKAPGIYRHQEGTSRLQLKPFFRLLSVLFHEMPLQKRISIWLATGKYVRGQAWQLGWLLDCRHSLRQGAVPPDQPGPWLRWFDRWFDPLTNHWLGYVLTALLVRAWFTWQLRR